MRTSHSNTTKNIVILGAGFGGLRAATRIAQELKKLKLTQQFHVTLIDRHAYHTFTPLLYEIATTSQELADYCKLKSLVAYPLEPLLSSLSISFLHEEVVSIDCKKNIVQCTKTKLQYRYLVLALGAETNFFDIPELREHALQFKTFDHAIAIRNAITFAVSENPGIVNVVICGAGSTGVELASEIQSWTKDMKTENGKPASLRVTIVDGAPTILPGLDVRVGEKVSQRLSHIGINTILGSPVTNVDAHALTLQNGTMLLYQILIWTGGIQASSLAATLPMKFEKRGRVETNNTLTCLSTEPDFSLYENIFAIGDMACMYDPNTGKPTSQVARAAIQQGDIVAQNIITIIRRKEGFMKNTKMLAYTPRTYPYIIPVGGKYAVTKIGPFIISGFLAWMFKGLVEFRYLSSIMPFWTALTLWLRGLKIFIQNDRLG